ncbi:MAG: LytTR family DNA-binding domain-containing protein, partial [Devosia sp.]
FADFGTAGRLAYWFVVVVATYVVGQAVALFALATLGERMVLLPVRVGLAALLCSVPVTLIVLGVNLVAYGHPSGMAPLTLWLYCIAISLAVVTVITITGRSGTPSSLAAATAPAAVEPPPLLQRLPHPQRGRLLALSVKDHYVEVLTDRGKGLVLIRLSDAIKETGTVVGLQIHRSHWVALDAVKRVVRIEGKVAVELANGEKLPVSRGFLPAARAAGLVV